MIFLNFINKEIIRINEILSKNENINVLFNSKTTKFGKEKYNNKINNELSNLNSIIPEKINLIETIADKWLIQKGNNCRYNAFITFIYYTISPYLKSINDNQLVKLNELNDLILKLSENVTERNYYNIIIFYRKINFIQIMKK